MSKENGKVQKYIPKKIEIEAIQYTGDNYDDICVFLDQRLKYSGVKVQKWQAPMLYYEIGIDIIPIAIGNYIIKNPDGEYEFFTEEQFLLRYEKVKGET